MLFREYKLMLLGQTSSLYYIFASVQENIQQTSEWFEMIQQDFISIIWTINKLIRRLKIYIRSTG